MISYLFRNNAKINKDYLLKTLMDDFGLGLIDNSGEAAVLGNSDMFVDIDERYVTILLYNERTNIRKLTKYLLEKNHGCYENGPYT